MALIKCPECGKEVSDTCERCIHCGYIFNPTNRTMSQSSFSSKAEKITMRNNREKNMTGLIISLIFTLGGGIVALLCLANRSRFVGVVDTSEMDIGGQGLWHQDLNAIIGRVVIRTCRHIAD